VIVLNGVVIVYLVERHAPHSNIHTIGDALWWSAVTVTTVGYGDFYPVTTEGRITACLLMGTGLLTLAVVTAQVASGFVAQEPRKANPVPLGKEAQREVTLAELDQRLARIERLLTAVTTPSHQAGMRTRESGSEPDRTDSLLPHLENAGGSAWPTTGQTVQPCAQSAPQFRLVQCPQR